MCWLRKTEQEKEEELERALIASDAVAANALAILGLSFEQARELRTVLRDLVHEGDTERLTRLIHEYRTEGEA